MPAETKKLSNEPVSGQRPVIFGTAGHIDHGKSSLLKTLTGVDPDRLEEEQRRGMTIDIGFAFLNENIAFIDVPGHEKFIKNMVTGANTIDMALLVIAADDGIMPQTREHVEILNLLGIRSGLIVVNKIDLVNSEWLEMILEDIRQFVRGTFLENEPIRCVSAVTGAGIPELMATILQKAELFERINTSDLFRLPIDRAFIVKGYGTVVTGSVISGELRVGDELEIVPPKVRTKVRGIQSHGIQVESVEVGHRAAINLQNIEKDDLKRGYFLATPGYFQPTRLTTCRVGLLLSASPMKYNSIVRVHVGTGEFIAKIRPIGKDELLPGESCIAQILFDEEISVGFHDQLILRSYSPAATIGGATVLEVFPEPLRKKESAKANEIGKLIADDLLVCAENLFLLHPSILFSPLNIAQRLSISESSALNLLRSLSDRQKVVSIKTGYVSASEIPAMKERIIEILTQFHKKNPILSGQSKASLLAEAKLSDEMADWLTNELKIENKITNSGDKWRLNGFSPVLSRKQSESIRQIESTLIVGGFMPPDLTEIREKLNLPEDESEPLFAYLTDIGKIVIPEKN
ncbi:MAG: selenocysteine-specific translation elongation factor, partial [Candidatus Marinimicrobia bacterium]|nr:selenocysteine-specific translation elongation factor [Candidatus Neomarinimicrobiota bacterium]